MEATNEQNPLLTAPVGALLRKFAVPCVLSMLVSALYNIVDQIFIGQSVGYVGNAATTVVYPFTVIALALAMLIGDGSAALLSLSQGRGDQETSHRCVGHGIALTVILGVILAMVGALAMSPILSAFGATEASRPYAVEYMRVIIIGIPFFMFTSGMNSVIRADGSPAYAMVSTILGAVINLILDPIAIFVLHWGVRGAAIATIIGQIASCLMTAFYFRRPKSFCFQSGSFRFRPHVAGRICQLGSSSFITQISIVIITCVVNNLCVHYGPLSEYGADIPLSALGIVFKVFGIVIAFCMGIAVGGQPIIGYNYGAGRYDRARQTYRLVMLANVVVGVIAMLLFEFAPHIIIRLFGSESVLYNQYAAMCFRIFLAGILLCCLQKASSIFLQSIGKPVQATLLSLSRDVFFLLPGVCIAAYLGGVTGILWAGPVGDILSFALTVIIIIRELRVMKRTEPPQS